MTPPNQKKLPTEYVLPPPKPILTLLVLCLMAAGLSDGHTNWVDLHAFTITKFGEMLAKQDWGALFGYLASATFGQLTPWIWLINAFFLWSFGSLMEQKLLGWRYPVFFVAAICAPWFLINAQAGLAAGKLFIGPSLLLFFLLGGYMAFLPKKPFKPADWVKPGWKIFRDDSPPPILEKYWVSPWLFVTLFVLFQGILYFAFITTAAHLVAATHFDFVGQLYKGLFGYVEDKGAVPFTVISALESMLAGGLLAYALDALKSTASTKRPGGRLQIEVLHHYRELRALDMTHDQACEGAAKFTAVPIEVAKEWIGKGAAALKEQPKSQ